MPLSTQQLLLSLITGVGLNIPPPPCLPVYSTSGFDLMSIIARVATRAPFKNNPRTRRFDRPIVYASPSFYQLTGYEDHEVIGRNCRFLHPPMGMFARAKKVGTSLPRPFTKRWSRIRNVKRASLITGKAVRRLSISSLSSLSPGAHNTPDGAGCLSRRFSGGFDGRA